MTEHARVYGGSLYDLAVEEKLSEAIKEQLLVIKQLFRENPDYIRLLSEPSIKKDERTKLIEDAFGEKAERYLVSFLKLLCERGLLNEYEGCCDEYIRRFNADHNIAEAVVTSAVALNESQLTALRGKLERTSGKKVSIVQKIDPSVLAGLKVELEGIEMDGTASGKLSDISKKLNEIIM